MKTILPDKLKDGQFGVIYHKDRLTENHHRRIVQRQGYSLKLLSHGVTRIGDHWPSIRGMSSTHKYQVKPISRAEFYRRIGKFSKVRRNAAKAYAI